MSMPEKDETKNLERKTHTLMIIPLSLYYKYKSTK